MTKEKKKSKKNIQITNIALGPTIVDRWLRGHYVQSHLNTISIEIEKTNNVLTIEVLKND